MLKHPQQEAAVFIPAHIHLAHAEEDLFPAAVQQAQRQPAEGFVCCGQFVFRIPGLTLVPLGGEHVGLGKRLVQPLVPAWAADIQPELVIHGLVADQEGVSRCKKDRILIILLPGLDILGGNDAIRDHLNIFFADRQVRVSDRCIHRPAEFLDRFDQDSRNIGAVEVVMETEPGLA